MSLEGKGCLRSFVQVSHGRTLLRAGGRVRPHAARDFRFGFKNEVLFKNPERFSGQAAIGTSGLPGFGSQGFAVTLSGAVPNQIGLAIWGQSGAASLPFANGTLCVQPPLKRFQAQMISASGSASRSVPISAAMIGSQRWFQWWFRDPAHPDGSGVGLSDGLSVVACP